MIQAIIYTSNAGHTAAYAKLLGQQMNVPVFPLAQAKKQVPHGAEILYLGWLMAGSIKGYKAAANRYCTRAVCAVGMGGAETQREEVRSKNNIPAATPLFILQGGLERSKLRGVYQFMISVMSKAAGKALAEKKDLSPEEEDMLTMMLHGGNRVCLENLSEVLEWFCTLEKGEK